MITRTLLKVLWSVGGDRDVVDGLPRIEGREVEQALGAFQPGDLLLLGNNGVASHVAVYVGDGRIVHSVATEKTMRGWLGSLWDALWRPWRWLRGQRDHTGVIEETLQGFVDRFERDTWLAVRSEATEQQCEAGVRHIRGLVGRPYDYRFKAGDDHYYCTEIAVAFLDAALEPTDGHQFATRWVRVPGLLNTHVIEPVALLDGTGLRVVAANASARHRYDTYLSEAVVYQRES